MRHYPAKRSVRFAYDRCTLISGVMAKSLNVSVTVQKRLSGDRYR